MIIPLTVLSFLDHQESSLLLLCSTTGHVSLLPLLFRPQEATLRFLLVILHALCVLKWTEGQKSRLEVAYLFGLAGVCVFDTLAALVLPGLVARFPFLPLLVYSLYCWVGLTYSWLCLYWNMWCCSGEVKEKTRRQTKLKAS